MKKRQMILPVSILIFILLIGSFLRFYKLDNQSLWNDELYSVQIAEQNSPAAVIQQTLHDTHPPLYYLTLHSFISFLGSSEVIIRLPSAICGALSIALIFYLGWRMYSTFEALVAAGLLSVSLGPIYFGQEARSYSILILVTLLSTALLMRLLKQLDSNKKPLFNYIAYILTAASLLYIHYYGAFIIAFQFSVILLHSLLSRNPKRIWLIFLSGSLILILFLPWMPSFYYQITHNSSAGDFIPRTSFKTLTEFLSLALIPSTRFIIFSSLIILLFITFSIWNSLTNGKLLVRLNGIKDEKRFEDLVLVLWLAVPLIIALSISTFIKPFIVPRYLVILFPSIYLIIARFFRLLPIHTVLQSALAACFIVYVLVVFLSFHYYSDPCSTYAKDFLCKQQVREATKFVIQNVDHSQTMHIITCLWSKNDIDFYLRKFGSDMRVKENLCTLPDGGKTPLSLGIEDIWFVHGSYRATSPTVEEAIKKGYTLVKSTDFYQISVDQYKKK